MGNSKNLSNLVCKKYHFTYQTKNTINGMTYVGRHSTNDLNDGYIGSGKLLKRAIKKHGKENFKLEYLDFFNDFDSLIKEEEFIVDKSFCLSNNNYNIVEGGSNPVMYGELNPSWKGGISKDPNYKITGPYDFSGSNNPRYGYVYTEDEKIKMIKSQPKRRKIFYKGEIFESTRNFRKVKNKSYDYINHRCLDDKIKDVYYI